MGGANGAIYDPAGATYGPLKRDNATGTRTEFLIIGDSLSDEHNKKDWGVWVVELRKELTGTIYTINEQAVTGTPTRTKVQKDELFVGALERFNNLLAANPTPHTIVIATGVNNLRREVTFQQTAEDIEAMLKRGLATGAKVLLIGVYLPPMLQGADRQQYISDADKKYLKAQGLAATPNGWSIAPGMISSTLKN